MSRAILSLNAGSSSIKFRLADYDSAQAHLLGGALSRIGEPQALLEFVIGDGEKVREALGQVSHEDAYERIADLLARHCPEAEIVGVGHRIVHGGVYFSKSCFLDDDVLEKLRAIAPLAPLHVPHGILGLEHASRIFPEARQVACFDTAFHAQKPLVQDCYALSMEDYEAGIRRYGFHGLSFQSVMRQLGTQLGDAVEGCVAIAHLGSGASIGAVKNGKSVFNSMGFSTLDGLMMGTRPGHVDPGVILYWLKEGRTAEEIEAKLYKASGLLGISGISNDMRDLEGSDDPRAKLALELFVARAAEEIARAAVAMGGLDCLVFCGGVGENSAVVREGVVEKLGFMLGDGEVLVVITDEEAEIFYDTRALLEGLAGLG